MLSRMLSRRSRGQSFVEFALVAPLFFMVLCGIIVIGIAIFYQQQLTNAAREGAPIRGHSQCDVALPDRPESPA